MPGTTSRGFPYPLPADRIDTAGDIQRLAEAIDDHATRTETIVVTNQGGYSSRPYVHQFVYLVTTDLYGNTGASFTLLPFERDPVVTTQIPMEDGGNIYHASPFYASSTTAGFSAHVCNSVGAGLASTAVHLMVTAVGTYPLGTTPAP